MTLEQGLFRNFDDLVRRQLDAVWHTVSMRTKQARPQLCPALHVSAAGRGSRGRALRFWVALAAMYRTCSA